MAAELICTVSNVQILFLLLSLLTNQCRSFFLPTLSWYSATESNPLIMRCLMLFDDKTTSDLSSLSSLSSDRILFQSFMNRVWDLYKMQSQIALGCLHFPHGPVLLLAIGTIVIFLHIYSSKYIFIFWWWCWCFFFVFFFPLMFYDLSPAI